MIVAPSRIIFSMTRAASDVSGTFSASTILTPGSFATAAAPSPAAWL